MTRSNVLGEYLRARRELVDPAAAGLRVMGVRRTPGLRREEVATLAGISADYYLRLDGDVPFDRWSTIDADGISEGAANSGSPCHAAKDVPFDLRPSAKYRSEITVDTSDAAGQLVFGNSVVWKFPTA